VRLWLQEAERRQVRLFSICEIQIILLSFGDLGMIGLEKKGN
jgi:hypothetical protein